MLVVSRICMITLISSLTQAHCRETNKSSGKERQNKCIVALSLALCSHYGQAAVGAAPFPPSLPPSPCRYWELGERARAQLASRIALCSTHSLPARWGGGGDRGRVMSHCGASNSNAALGTARARSFSRSDRDVLRYLQWSRPIVNSFHLAWYLICHIYLHNQTAVK